MSEVYNFIDNLDIQNTFTHITIEWLKNGVYFGILQEDGQKVTIQDLINRIDSIIDNKKFTILMTHSDLSVLKHEKELLKYFDLILTKTNSNLEQTSFFDRFKPKENKVINNFLIENGGVHQTEEMDFIKIRKYKK